MVDVDIPFRLIEWTQARIESPLVFLLALNVFLLLVGCFMDIFSAIVVVVPLISGIGAAYGIDPVHLGIIFIANLELGFLTPPVGFALFYLKGVCPPEVKLTDIYRGVVPFVLLQLAGLAIVFYFPEVATWLPSVAFK